MTAGASSAPPPPQALAMADQALACALWMEAEGFSTLRHVGPFGLALPRSQSRCWVLPGSLVCRSAEPPGAGRMTEAPERVKVQSTTPGRVDAPGGSGVVAPRVHWIDDEGEAWWTDANNVRAADGAVPCHDAPGMALQASTGGFIEARRPVGTSPKVTA